MLPHDQSTNAVIGKPGQHININTNIILLYTFVQTIIEAPPSTYTFRLSERETISLPTTV